MKKLHLILCCAVAAFCVLAAGCRHHSRREPRQITVRGVAEIKVPPDHVVVRTRVVTLDKDIEKSQADNDTKVKQTLGFVKKLGVEARDISTEYARLEPKYRRRRDEEPVFEGYEASKSITVTLRDLSKYDRLISGLLKQGVNRVSGITFKSSKEIEHRVKARIQAIKAARAKAKYLAEQMDMSVGHPLWINEFQQSASTRGSWANGRNWASNAGSMAPSSSSSAEADAKHGTIAPGSITIRAWIEAGFELRH